MMKLRSKILLALIGVFTAYVFVDSVIHVYVVYPHFVSLERREASINLRRCSQAIKRDIEYLDALAHDWSSWGDLQRYVSGANDSFEDHNLVDSLFPDSNLNVIAIIDLNRNVLHLDVRDHDQETPIALPAFPRERWGEDHLLLGHENSTKEISERTIHGLIMTANGPMEVASRPIVPNGNRLPISGTLIMGRFLNQKKIDLLCEQTEVDFAVANWNGNRPKWSEGTCLEPQPGDQFPINIEELSEETLVADSFLVDLSGKPILVIRAEQERSISERGRQAMFFAIGSLVLAACTVLGLMFLLLQRIVIRPLMQLSEHAEKIGSTKDLTARANLNRSDELGILAMQFDAMVEQLSESQSRLIELSREAGMSDVAIGLLHNVGNVMTNVTILNSSIGNRLRSSKLKSLKKSTDLIRAHESDLDRFFVEDDRGRKLPGFICQVYDKVEREHQDLLNQVQSMSDNLTHVAEILDAHKKFASGASAHEPVKLDRLISDTVKLLSESLDRYGIQWVIECDDMPSLSVDRGKLIQILINLIGNARDALIDIDSDDRRIEISAHAIDSDRVTIRVVDNGCGILAESINKIFSSGFTTKSYGQGHGLHFCSLAARELGGSVSVTSQGLGKGATFELSFLAQSINEQVST